MVSKTLILILTRSRWRLSVCVLNIHPKACPFMAIKLTKVEIKIFQTVMWPHFAHLTKESCWEVSSTKLAACPVSWTYIFYRLKQVLYLSRDPTRAFNWGAMHIYGWEILAACHHPEKFSGDSIMVVKRKNASSKKWIW